MKTIIHEVTHVKQKEKKELSYSDGYLIWKGQRYSLEEYQNANTKELHNSFPWEKEAIEMPEKLYKMFLQSKYLHNLKGMSPTLDYIIDNIT